MQYGYKRLFFTVTDYKYLEKLRINFFLLFNCNIYKLFIDNNKIRIVK